MTLTEYAASAGISIRQAARIANTLGIPTDRVMSAADVAALDERIATNADKKLKRDIFLTACNLEREYGKQL